MIEKIKNKLREVEKRNLGIEIIEWQIPQLHNFIILIKSKIIIADLHILKFIEELLKFERIVYEIIEDVLKKLKKTNEILTKEILGSFTDLKNKFLIKLEKTLKEKYPHYIELIPNIIQLLQKYITKYIENPRNWMLEIAEIMKTIKEDNLDGKRIHKNHIKNFLENELKKDKKIEKLEDNILEDIVLVILEIRQLKQKFEKNDYLEELINKNRYLIKTFESKDVLKKIKRKIVLIDNLENKYKECKTIFLIASKINKNDIIIEKYDAVKEVRIFEINFYNNDQNRDEEFNFLLFLLTKLIKEEGYEIELCDYKWDIFYIIKERNKIYESEIYEILFKIFHEDKDN
jgi:hypothetical protein